MYKESKMEPPTLPIFVIVTVASGLVNHSPLVVGFLSRSHPYLLVVCCCFHLDALYPLLFTKPEIELVLLPERWTSPFLLKTKQNQKKAKLF